MTAVGTRPNLSEWDCIDNSASVCNIHCKHYKEQDAYIVGIPRLHKIEPLLPYLLP